MGTKRYPFYKLWDQTVSRAKSEVQEFAKHVIRWVDGMKVAFESHRGGTLTKATRKSLVQMRALIDEICKWATARLEDGRWSRITHGLRIAHEIDEFKSRITDARALFMVRQMVRIYMDVSAVNISQGLDAIIQEVYLVRKLQRNQLKNISDKLDEQTQLEARRQFLSHMLLSRTVENATYDEQGKQPCDADTRVEILADIQKWVYDVSHHSQNFLWLTGDPGSGKSAITASLSRECKDAGILWAQFFINRNNMDTTDPKLYFPSIAHQLVDHIPDSNVALAIHDILKKTPSLLDDISNAQASKLFVQAIEVAAVLDPRIPVVVVIDGLDETRRERLRETAEIFSQLFVGIHSHNVKVFISSRTEDDIQKPFSDTFNVKHVKHIHLDTSDENSIQDVSQFLQRRIALIVEKNDLNWVEWPGDKRMQTLCTHAAGLFIWAVTVIKFFQEEIIMFGRECLDYLLDELSTRGMGDINVLYSTILKLVHRDNMDNWASECFRRIVGAIIVLQEPISIGELEGLLNLRRSNSSIPVDILHFICRYRTILVAGSDAIDDKTVPRLHKSFFEFITSEHADHQFRINYSSSNAELALHCLHQFTGLYNQHNITLSTKTSSKITSLSGQLRYALKFWSFHLGQEKKTMSGIAIVGNASHLSKFQKILQTTPTPLSSQISNLNPLNIVSTQDRTRILISWANTIHIWNEESGNLIGWPVIGHKFSIYSTAFSPDGRYFLSGGGDHTIRLWHSHSGQPVRPPMHNNSRVNTVAFSPDGNYFASGCQDGTLYIWQTYSDNTQPIIVHNLKSGAINSICFSLDGKNIVAGGKLGLMLFRGLEAKKPSYTTTLRIDSTISDVQCLTISSKSGIIALGTMTGHVYHWRYTPFASDIYHFDTNQGMHTGPVYSIVFSPSESLLVSGGQDGIVYIWSMITYKIVHSLTHHNGAVYAVAFSPNGKYIISGGYDKCVHIWNSETFQLLFSTPTDHTGPIFSIVFSSDGKEFISAGEDNTIRCWNLETGGQKIGSFLYSTHSWITSAAFLQIREYIVFTSLNSPTQFWNVDTGQCLELSLKGVLRDITFITVSPDKSRIVATSNLVNALTVFLWDSDWELVSQMKVSIDEFISLSFSPDSTQLVLTSITGATFLWDAMDGKPISNSAQYLQNSIWSDKVQSFDIGNGQSSSEHEAVLWWLPHTDPNAGVWICIDNKVIRSHGSGSLSIMDISDILHDKTELYIEGDKVVG